MKSNSIFHVYKQISPFATQSFIILETVFTSDGPRTRACEGRYADEETAIKMKESKEQYIANVNEIGNK